MRLIVGLGNPGKRYRRSRHNVGLEVTELLAERKGVRLKRKWRLKACVARAVAGGSPMTLAVPRTFMNQSGQAVEALLRWGNFSPSELLVVSDDVHLELGRIRIRRRGGSGGHKGLQSIIASIGTEDFGRMRIGVGPGKRNRVEHVLGRFDPKERGAVEKAIEKAMMAVEMIIIDGIDAAMNRFNSPFEG